MCKVTFDDLTVDCNNYEITNSKGQSAYFGTLSEEAESYGGLFVGIGSIHNYIVFEIAGNGICYLSAFKNEEQANEYIELRRNFSKEIKLIKKRYVD